LSTEALRRLAGGSGDDRIVQADLDGLRWPAEDRRVLRYRLAALEAQPTAAPYLLHMILDSAGSLLGRIGCHAAPDDQGEVEIGYFVLPGVRGSGVASRAVDLFLDWLTAEGVRSAVASVRPDNEASLTILRRRGFVEFGSQVDDEDGLELLMRRSLRPDTPALPGSAS